MLGGDWDGVFLILSFLIGGGIFIVLFIIKCFFSGFPKNKKVLFFFLLFFFLINGILYYISEVSYLNENIESVVSLFNLFAFGVYITSDYLISTNGKSEDPEKTRKDFHTVLELFFR